MNRLLILGLFIICMILINCTSHTNFAKGKAIYINKCQSCHMEDGSGLGTYIPTLIKPAMDYSLQICTISRGRGSNNLVMPAFSLSEVEFANLINYLNEKFGNKKVYLPKDIDKLIKICP